MTLTEIVEIAATRVGCSPKLFWGFAQALIQTLVEEIENGNTAKVQGLGTFLWVDVPGKEMPDGSWAEAGRKLKFKPAKKFARRWIIGVDRSQGKDWTVVTKVDSSEEGMTKYGVVLDDKKTKTAAKKRPGQCPDCNKETDSGGACPDHGTEPLEPKTGE